MRSKRAEGSYRGALSASIILTAAALITIAHGVACSSSDSTNNTTPTNPDAGGPEVFVPPPIPEPQLKEEATRSIPVIISRQLIALNTAATDIFNAAPTPAGRGWDATQDAAAITTMKEAWHRAHIAYEHVQAQMVVPYPDLDAAIDSRYEDFLAKLGATGDATPFDDTGVTGIRAIERILYADAIPPAVVTYEKTLAGYKDAAFPKTEAEAADFKNKLVQKLVTDSKSMNDQWLAAPADLPTEFQRITLMVRAQRDLLAKAATPGAERSRYSNQTLADLQAILEGTDLSYKLFQPWLLFHKNPADLTKHGPAHDKKITAALGDLQAAYTTPPGEAMPAPPAGYNPTAPSEADLASPYGLLVTAANTAADPTHDGSVASELNIAGAILAIPPLP